MEDSVAEKTDTLPKAEYYRVTSRSFENYRHLFGIKPEEFSKNAVIFDVGSGKNQEFARYLAKVRPDIKVISLDPTLVLPTDDKSLKKMGINYDIESVKNRIRKTTKVDRDKRIKNKFGEVVAAKAPHLPFADQSFDYIYDNHGPFMYLTPDRVELGEYVRELVRVLKPAGMINIYPLDTYSETLLEDQEKLAVSRSRIQEIMQDLGVVDFTVFSALDVGRHERLGIKITKK